MNSVRSGSNSLYGGKHGLPFDPFSEPPLVTGRAWLCFQRGLFLWLSSPSLLWRRLRPIWIRGHQVGTGHSSHSTSSLKYVSSGPCTTLEAWRLFWWRERLCSCLLCSLSWWEPQPSGAAWSILPLWLSPRLFHFVQNWSNFMADF